MPAPASIDRELSGRAQNELVRVRLALAEIPPRDRKRIRQAKTDKHRLDQLSEQFDAGFHELQAILKRSVGPGRTGTDQGELAADLRRAMSGFRSFRDGLLAWCEDNTRPLTSPRAVGRPKRTPFHDVIHRLVNEDQLSARDASKRVANQLLEHHWRLNTLTDDEFELLFPNMERTLPRVEIEKRLAESLRVAYQDHLKVK